MTDRAAGEFSAATREISDIGGADDAATAEFGAPVAVWARGEDRLLAFGVAHRVVSSGARRIREAADAWRALIAGARIDDPLRLPGTGLIALGAFAFADGSATPSTLVVPRRVVGRRDGVAFVTDIGGHGDPAAPAAPATAPGDRFARADYEAAVSAAVARIRNGGLEKVVLARDLALEVPPGFDVTGALRVLRRRYRDAWTFAVDGFFGASPETLATVHGNAVTARVLAGTAARDDDPVVDASARDALLASPKNRFEHALAVDSLLLTLGGMVDDLTLGRPFALGLPNVWHLATDATALLTDGRTALDLVDALHPTAAVAGAPRDAALALIEELEPFDRGRYAGPVGWIGATGDGEWAIGLRSAQIETPDRVRAYAGAGIVAGSVAKSELAETGWKFAPVLEALGLPLSAATGPRAGSDPVAVP
ncbi:isochorismate synthase MenF [Amnibacterium sp.]|uniref:isochorismate synthase n=1 Tax=Amnibacterium sp. TaxID=1872496 RepID=UPI00262F876A|nr:isochorismate synthase [Amnibacterium sp.]